MAAPEISEHLLRQTCELIARYGSLSGAARASGIPRATLQTRYERAKQLAYKYSLTVPSLVGTTSTRAERRPLPESAEGFWRRLDEAIGRAVRPPKPPPPAGTQERLVIAGDLHAPFHEPDAVAHLIAEEGGGKSHTLILNGDIQDFYAISRFAKYERVTIEQELAAVDALLGQFSAAFPRVVIVCGNHDRPRFERQLRTVLSQDMVEVVEFLTGGQLDPIAMLARRYPNIEMARHSVGRHNVGWFYQHGDLLCAHAEKFSRVPGTALRALHEWFEERRQTLQLEPWRVLVQAHTHQFSMIPWMSDALLVEGGCLCQTHGYQLDAKVAGRPQRRGYVTLEQVRGRTQLDSVKFVWWDARRAQEGR